jgi:hypothetical protein
VDVLNCERDSDACADIIDVVIFSREKKKKNTYISS